MKPSVMIASCQAKMWIRCLLNSGLMCYHYTNLSDNLMKKLQHCMSPEVFIDSMLSMYDKISITRLKGREFLTSF